MWPTERLLMTWCAAPGRTAPPSPRAAIPTRLPAPRVCQFTEAGCTTLMCGLKYGIPVDTTGDGKANAIGFDTNGDGRINALDTTGDGNIDTLLQA